ncbi:MAG: hypothetical protein KBG54_00515 [Oscillospiraceae bacterium]|nr:hypothetical protein [Oscillospiraceae bacterium]
MAKNDLDIHLWKNRLATAKAFYKSEYEEMDRREALYAGTHEVIPANGAGPAKQAGNVRNIVYELIESGVDCAVPVPQVNAASQRGEALAKNAETLLRAEVEALPFKEMNDAQERMCPVQGSAAFLVEWCLTGEVHGKSGRLAVSLLHPRQILPQPGAADIEDAAWIIVQMSKTGAALQARYGSAAAEEAASPDDIFTVNIGYFKNKSKGIGRFTWVNDTVLEALSDYEMPRTYRCGACDTLGAEETCTLCGKKAVLQTAEKLMHSVTPISGEKLAEGTKIPIYRPRIYPIVLRKNVSSYGKFFGQSDVDKIRDQQETIKKLGSKIDEKVLKGGSYITLPAGVTPETTDRELKILRVKSPADKNLIDVYNIQPDISKDRVVLEENYQWAKSTLGITDAFQGKRDATATSGVAKQYSINQASGRLESKRVMKNAAYARLFAVMFRFLLAYSDESCPIAGHSATGETEYRDFCRYSFLRRDDAGTLYWDDDFVFTVDPGGTMAGNRQAMWQETRESFSLGAFGAPATKEAQLLYWGMLESLQYPLAGIVKKRLEEQSAALTAQAASMQNAAQIPQWMQMFANVEAAPKETENAEMTKQGGDENVM